MLIQFILLNDQCRDNLPIHSSTIQSCTHMLTCATVSPYQSIPTGNAKKKNKKKNTLSSGLKPRQPHLNDIPTIPSWFVITHPVLMCAPQSGSLWAADGLGTSPAGHHTVLPLRSKSHWPRHWASHYPPTGMPGVWFSTRLLSAIPPPAVNVRLLVSTWNTHIHTYVYTLPSYMKHYFAESVAAKIYNLVS